MASKHLPNFRQGDDYTLKITYPALTNITGFKFYLTLKTSFEDLDNAAVLQATHIAGTGAFDEPLNGICYLTVPASITATIPKGSYYYDLQCVSTGGEVQTLAPPIDDYRHKLVVIPQVTRLAT